VSYARIVGEMAYRRNIITAATEMARMAHSKDPLHEVSAKIQSNVMGLVGTKSAKKVTSKQAASRAIDLVFDNPRFFTFGIKNLDDKMGGIFPQRFYVWAGFQGTGKSAMMIQNARRNADAGHKVVLVTLEMSPEQVYIRMACGDLGISFDGVLSGKVSDDDKQAVVDLAGVLGDRYEDKIIMYPSPMTLMDILSAAKTDRPDIMWIDHSRLIGGKPDNMSGYEWAMHIPTFLRQNISKLDNGISVHLLMQVNRSAFKESRRPTMHDLRMAGEDDPDMVTLLYRPYNSDDLTKLPEGQVVVEFITDKNRFGWTGTEKVIFDLPYQTFIPSVTEMQSFK
jgi:replicative DNA helicase